MEDKNITAFWINKMLFQKEHLQTLLELANFKDIKITHDKSKNILDKTIQTISFQENCDSPYLIANAKKRKV